MGKYPIADCGIVDCGLRNKNPGDDYRFGLIRPISLISPIAETMIKAEIRNPKSEMRRRIAKMTDNKEEKTQGEQLPEAGFSELVMMLATGAWQQLGVMPNPITQKEEKNLEMAKHMIDLLALMEEKTKGNLSETEAKLLSEALYNLRMAYIEAVKK
ncbi:MAG: DUF1844 domain-containing protein [bacterium]|nr:DUF1844 domain-containing protein [bacterium]